MWTRARVDPLLTSHPPTTLSTLSMAAVSSTLTKRAPIRSTSMRKICNAMAQLQHQSNELKSNVLVICIVLLIWFLIFNVFFQKTLKRENENVLFERLLRTNRSSNKIKRRKLKRRSGMSNQQRMASATKRRRAPTRINATTGRALVATSFATSIRRSNSALSIERRTRLCANRKRAHRRTAEPRAAAWAPTFKKRIRPTRSRNFRSL